MYHVCMYPSRIGMQLKRTCTCASVTLGNVTAAKSRRLWTAYSHCRLYVSGRLRDSGQLYQGLWRERKDVAMSVLRMHKKWKFLVQWSSPVVQSSGPVQRVVTARIIRTPRNFRGSNLIG